MAEERRFFLRTALYAGGIAVVYWFVSYEAAGTAMLAVLAAAAAGLTVVLAHLDPARGRSTQAGSEERPGRLLSLATAAVTFEDPAEAAPAPLGLTEEALPALSLQPLLVAIGGGAVSLGLVFGAWLWAPGAALLALSTWRWFTELDA